MLIVVVPNAQNVKIWELANQIVIVSVIFAKMIHVFVSFWSTENMQTFQRL